MKDLFIPYEEALTLKELGFDEPCFAYYSFGDEIVLTYTEKQMVSSGCCLTPTFSQAFKWFRKEHKLFASIEYSTTNQTDFVITINKKSYNDARDEEYKTYEEAELACLKKLIELLKK
jgi:hypothetical protein